MKIFVSVPKGGMTVDEFCKAREAAKKDAKRKAVPKSDGVSAQPFDPEICDNYLEDFESEDKAKLMAKNIGMLSSADAAYFADGWKKCASCQTEHSFCESLGINILKD